MSSTRALVVVPTRAHLDDHLRRLAASDGVAVGLGTLDFAAFRRRLVRACGPRAAPSPSPSPVLVRVLTSEHLGLSPRRARRFVRLWDTLRDAGLDVARLERIAARRSGGQGGKIEDFVELARRYERARAELGLVDDAATTARLADGISRLPEGQLRAVVEGAERVEIHAGLDVSPARARWLDALARRVPVHLAVPGDELARAGLERARRSLAELGPNVDVVEAGPGAGLGARLVEAWGSGPVDGLGAEAVRLVTVDPHSVRAEVAALVEALESRSVAVVDVNAAHHGDAWLQAFANRGLPLEDRRGRRLADTVAGRALLGAIDVARHDMHRERLCDWLAGPWARGWLSPEGGDPRGVDGAAGRRAAESLRASLRAVGSRDDRGDGHVERLRAGGAASHADALASVLERLRWPPRLTLLDACARARALLSATSLGTTSRFDDERSPPAIAREREALASARDLDASLEAWSEALAALGSSRPRTRDEIARVFAEEWTDVRHRRPGSRRGRVVLATPDDLAGRRFDDVVFVGLVDGEFPRARLDDGFLDPVERRAIEAALGRPVFRRARSHDAMRFSGALAAATHRIRAVVPEVDARGAPLGGRSFFDGLAQVSGAEIERRTASVTAPDRGRWGLGPVRVVPRPTAVGRLRDGRATAHARLGLHADRAVWWTTSASALEQYAACPYQFFAERVLGLGDGDALDELDARSAGRLGHEIMAAVFAALQAGGLLPLRGGASAGREDRVARVAAEHVLARWRVEQPVGVRPFFELEAERLHHAVRSMLAAERARARDGWVPFAFELGFGGAETGAGLDGLTLADPAGDAEGPREARPVVVVRGRIDRLDTRGDGERRELLVVDYKRGRVGTRVRAAELGRTQLQLPLYSMWAREHADPLLARGDPRGEGAVVGVDARLVSLDDGRRSHSSVMDCVRREPSLEDLLSQDVEAAASVDATRVAVGARDLPRLGEEGAPRRVVDTVWAYVRAIATGRFDARPVDPRVCVRCPHGAVCRIAESASSPTQGAEAPA